MRKFIMNWNIQKARTCDAEAIACFQVAMAMESEGLALDEGTVMKGVQAALGNPSKGLYFVARDESGIITGSLFLTKDGSILLAIFIRQERGALGRRHQSKALRGQG